MRLTGFAIGSRCPLQRRWKKTKMKKNRPKKRSRTECRDLS